MPRVASRLLPAHLILGVLASLAVAGPRAQTVPAAQAPASAQPAAPAPRLVIAKTTHDAGIVGFGTEPIAEFTIRNDGRAPLTISVATPRPGLRLVKADETIAPKKSGVVRLAIDTFRAGATTEWRTTITTNDPAQPAIDLIVKAEVRELLALTPPSARFTFVQYAAEGGTSHVLAAADGRDVTVLGVDSPFDYIRAAWREATPDERVPDLKGRQWRIALTILRTARVGPIGDYLVVRTNHPEQPRVFLPVSGFVRPLFAVTPPTVRLPAVSLGAAAQTSTPAAATRPLLTLVVKNFGAEPLEISRVTSDVAGLDATIVPVTTGHDWRVELRLSPASSAENAAIGPFKGTLRLQTTSVDVPEVVVTVEGERVAATSPPR